MVRKDGAETKKERIVKIAQTLQAMLFQAKEKGMDYIPLENTKALVEFDTGLTPEKIASYFAVIQKIGQIEIDTEKDQIKKPRV